MTLRPIGTLHTPWRTIAECPRNGRQPNPPPLCTAVVLPEFVEGLRSVETLSHLILLYWLDQARSAELVFTPPFDDTPRGIFATRSPRRPNPIGLSVVALEKLNGDTLHVRYLDCVDGTPLLDIKPYFASTDSVPDAVVGWHAERRR